MSTSDGQTHAGRVAVVTGGASGLGRAHAERLAADGARVVIADVGDGEETLARIRAAGGESDHVRCDVSVEGDVAALAEAAGPVDILINNAGISPNVPWGELEFTEWRRVLSVNLDAMFLTSKAFTGGMRERGWGRVVNITSNTYGLVIEGFAAYVASKGGVIGFTRALATDLGKHGITVNAVAPGLTRTPDTEEKFSGTDFFAVMTEMQAVKRESTPADLAATVSFLASEDASFISGQTLVVDGGLVRH